MLIDLLYIALVVGNLLLLTVAYLLGPRVNTLVRVAAILNGMVLLLFVIPLSTLLCWPSSSPESGAAIRILFPTTLVLVLQILGLAVLYRRNSPPPAP